MSIEDKYVHDVYERIAKKFDHTRAYLWKGIKEFLLSLPEHSFVLDAGCGNGKHLLFREDLYMFGIDMCVELLKICDLKGVKSVVQANTNQLPFKEMMFDYTISIAVVHHIHTYESRLQALKELLRVTKTSLYIQVWAIEAVEDTKHPEKFEHLGNNDYLVNWDNNELSKRYYHLFTENEFTKLIKNVEDIADCTSLFFEMNNWGAILTKK